MDKNTMPVRPMGFSREHRLAILFLALNVLARLIHPAFLPRDFMRGLGAGFGMASVICYILLLIRIPCGGAADQDANTGS